MADADPNELEMLLEPIDEPTGDEDPDGEEHQETDEEKEQKRFQYWQSKYAKEKERADKLALLEPIGKLIDERPDVLLTIKEMAIKGPTKDVPVELKAPQKPARPVEFDSAASVGDPESESFKFRVANEKYMTDFTDYLEKREALRQESFDKQMEKQVFEAAEKARTAKLRLILTQKGLPAESVEDFFQVMDSPDSYSVDNLIELYKLKKGKPGDKAKEEALRKRQERQESPIPGIDGGESANPKKLDEHQAFNKGIFAAAGKPKK